MESITRASDPRSTFNSNIFGVNDFKSDALKTNSVKVAFLSNAELLTRFGKLVQTERKITHLVLECIAEIDSRKLYLDKAYPSLYDFLVQQFGYSSSAALRRIESARLLREVPEVAARIESGALNLSQLSKVQQAVRAVQKIEDRKLNVEEKKDLLRRIENTTQQQTEVILSQALSLPIMIEDKEKNHCDESVTLTITLSKEQMAILKQAQDLIAHAVPEKKWAEAITYLAQKEINRRTKLRKFKMPSQGANAGDESRLNQMALSTAVVRNKQTSVVKQNAAISTVNNAPNCMGNLVDAVPVVPNKALNNTSKKIILNRDKCCQYKDKTTGKICGGTRFLQTDHRQSVWADGTNELKNLQALCAQHNQHKYRKESFLR